MNFDGIEKIMLEALAGKPLEKKIDERLQARIAYQETLKQQKRFVRDREYICRVCGKSTNLKTADTFNNIHLGGAQHPVEFIAKTMYGRYVLKDDDVVFVGSPVAFVVCSDECRRTWLKKWARPNKVVMRWCRFFIDIPANVTVHHSLDPLKSDIADEKGKTFREKLEQIESLVDGPKGFYLWGAPGNGKTTIAAWLAYEYLVRENAVRWVTYSQLQEVLSVRCKDGF